MRGQAYARTGKVHAVSSNLEKASTLAPHDKAINLELSNLHTTQGNHLEQVVSTQGVHSELVKPISS